MIVFHIFISLMLMASGTYATRTRCTPGHSYNDGCNDCTCTDQGDGYACTMKLCEDNPIFCDTRGTTVGCPVGHCYYDGCNWCSCNKGQEYVCTTRACYNNPVVCFVR